MNIYGEVAASGCRQAKDLVTFKCGGTLKNVFEPKSIKEFARVITSLENRGEKLFLLGGGSNVIVADGEVETPVVLTAGLNKICIENGFAFAECGAKISDILRIAREHALGGLEFLAGVPLTLGGAVRMNASAFGIQICDLVEGVFVLSRVCDAHGELRARIKELGRNEIAFGYRKGVEGTIVGAKLRLNAIKKSASLDKAREYLAVRRLKQPCLPSCGSVFKNADVPAGKLIEGCGLKGLKIGGAKISETHANFIVNEGGAKTSDFLSLVEICEREVKKKYNVKLEREFCLLK